MADCIIVSAILALLSLACVCETREVVMGQAASRAGVSADSVRGAIKARSWAVTRAVLAETAAKALKYALLPFAYPYLAVAEADSRMERAHGFRSPMMKAVKAVLLPLAVPHRLADSAAFEASARTDEMFADLVEDARRAKDAAEWEGGY